MKNVFKARIQDGKLQSRAFAHFLSLAKEGEEYSITVSDLKPKRSDAQNAYYWGVYLPIISRETGYTTMELHELFKKKFLKAKMVEVMGVEVFMVASTTKLNKKEFTEYIMNIELFTGIPSPPTVEYGL